MRSPCQPEMCSLNMGSMNFGLYPHAEPLQDVAARVGAVYLEGSRDFIFQQHVQGHRVHPRAPRRGCGTRFEFECYDVGHLYNLAHFVERKLVKPPFFVQTIFGILGGIGADADNLLHMRRTADSLFGDDYDWSVLARRTPPDAMC